MSGVSQSKSILWQESDPFFGRKIHMELREQGYESRWVRTLSEAWSASQERRYDLVLLDLSEQSEQSFEVFEDIKLLHPNLPIIILCGSNDEAPAVRSLTSGVSDFVRKPVSPKELLLRIRRTIETQLRPITVGPVSICPRSRRVLFHNTPIPFTRSEFDLFMALARKPGELVTRERLLGVIDPEGNLFWNVLKAHFSRMRRKFVEMGAFQLKITSVYGLGYRLESCDETQRVASSQAF